jgi:CRISPR-associated endonuclease/helicase Cas3
MAVLFLEGLIGPTPESTGYFARAMTRLNNLNGSGSFFDVLLPPPSAQAGHRYPTRRVLRTCSRASCNWLSGSVRTSASLPGEDRTQTCRERARAAVRWIGLDVASYREHLAAATPSFAAVFGTPAPYPAQSAMSDGMLGQVVVLEAETGSGKTEAALWRFLHLFARGEVDGLYFALPTRVAASQAYARVRHALERAWPEGAPVAVRALPGYAAADGETAIPLPDFKVLWSDDPLDSDTARRWAAESSKRFLAATVAVEH